MKKYRTILIDADGTIFDFDACEREALRIALTKHGYMFNEDILSLYSGINLALWKRLERGEVDRQFVIYERFRKLFEELGIEDDGVSLEDYYQVILGMQHFYIEDAPKVLDYLHQKYDIYAVTNGITATQLSRFKGSGADKYMKRIFVSEETGFQKPRKEFFDYCFERIDNINLSETIIIGDSLTSDILGGNNAGIDTCWFNPGAAVNNTNAMVDIEIRKLRELMDIL